MIITLYTLYMCSFLHVQTFQEGLVVHDPSPTPKPQEEASLTLTIIPMAGTMLAILALTLTIFTLIAFG